MGIEDELFTDLESHQTLEFCSKESFVFRQISKRLLDSFHHIETELSTYHLK